MTDKNNMSDNSSNSSLTNKINFNEINNELTLEENVEHISSNLPQLDSIYEINENEKIKKVNSLNNQSTNETSNNIIYKTSE